MKKTTYIAFIVLALSLVGFWYFTIPISADGGGDVVLGEQLFTSKEGLGTKIACILCHKDDKAIKKERVAALGAQLPETINNYIVTKAKGTAIATDSEEMKALVAYITEKHSR